MTDDLPPWAHVAHPAPPSPRRRYVVDLPDGERGIAVAEVLRNTAQLMRDGDGHSLPLHPQSMAHAALSALLAGRVEEVPR